MKAHLLIVDDEEAIRRSLCDILQDEDYQVTAAAGGEEALRLLAAPNRKVDAVLLDIWMKGMDGLTALEAIRRIDPELAVIMISGHGNIETAVKATKLGAYDFIEKPLSIDKVLLVLSRALEARQLETQNRLLRARLHGEVRLHGGSPAIAHIREQIETVAPTSAWVLLTGENGTGKEIAARSIHQLSPLRARPFVEVNCAAIPEELIESELFGHEKGAFTGAVARKIGRFEAADGGTLFLDEIGDMSLKTQAKVLRVLQEGAFERVGGAETIHAQVRLVSATNKNLPERIREGDFREDLYYRISVVPLHLPPLRERREDIPRLADHFLAMLAAEGGEEPKRFSQEAMALLTEYPWPGNVRELKNLVERLVVMTGPNKRLIRREDIPADLAAAVKADLQQDLSRQETLAAARRNFERGYIAEKLAESGGNISRTAERLGISRENLSKKIKTLGIETRRDEG